VTFGPLCTYNYRLVQPTAHCTGIAEIWTWRCVKAISAPPTAHQLAYCVRWKELYHIHRLCLCRADFAFVNSKLHAFWRSFLSQNKAHTCCIVLCVHYNIWNSWPIPTKLAFLSLEASSPSYLFKFPAVQRDTCTTCDADVTSPPLNCLVLLQNVAINVRNTWSSVCRVIWRHVVAVHVFTLPFRQTDCWIQSQTVRSFALCYQLQT